MRIVAVVFVIYALRALADTEASDVRRLDLFAATHVISAGVT
jgi:hypothetical protein